ncbi:hypothetical protein BH09BAC5_BH09BAC5_01490 [soil metagenome]
MNAKHWDNLADVFEEEVMSSVHSDKNRCIVQSVKNIRKKDDAAETIYASSSQIELRADHFRRQK